VNRGGLFVALMFSAFLWAGTPPAHGANAKLNASTTQSGYLALLLINEVPFPGERGYKSMADSKAAMLSILWVLHSRIHYIPRGYTQKGIAMVSTRSIIDVITVGGVKGQVDGFYKDKNGDFKAVPRVHERVNYLVKVGNTGAPGKFAALLNHAQSLASAYFRAGPTGGDLFEDLKWIGQQPVTGRSYSWMTDHARFNPGGTYVRIPDHLRGSLGGNRFFTLERAK
jgi:hypothetical protein